MRGLHAGLLALGAVAFAAMLRSVGWDALLTEAQRLGAGVLLVVVFGGLELALHTLAWRVCLTPTSRPRFRDLWGPYLVANALNSVTPTATVGGEVVRATLLPESVSRREAIAALALDRLAHARADALLALPGLAYLALAPGLDAVWRVGLVGAVGAVAVGILIFGWLQRRGRLLSLAAAHPWFARVVGRAAVHTAEGVDAHLAEAHATRTPALWASVALHGLGNAMVAAQIAVVLGFAGREVAPAAVLQIFVVVTALDLASFFVPARLGALEGARVLALATVGLSASLGLVLALAQRLDQLAWSGAGLVLYSKRVVEDVGTETELAATVGELRAEED
ncbi:MAG: flippase-like domain-containing protein [Proteobacteria bacterium]|nr:flippase-like domain-containing protein [Pseudomonadota bacterium]